jgi:hypothetical protein
LGGCLVGDPGAEGLALPAGQAVVLGAFGAHQAAVRTRAATKLKCKKILSDSIAFRCFRTSISNQDSTVNLEFGLSDRCQCCGAGALRSRIILAEPEPYHDAASAPATALNVMFNMDRY